MVVKSMYNGICYLPKCTMVLLCFFFLDIHHGKCGCIRWQYYGCLKYTIVLQFMYTKAKLYHPHTNIVVVSDCNTMVL